MIVISHRGYWGTSEEKNSLAAFHHSFSLGFGTETDIRDYQGELVISHDMADSLSVSAKDFFALYRQYDTDLPLALNIKADGLQTALEQLLEEYAITNYFVFDMSVPDGLGYLRRSLNVFTRQSEYEKEPSYYIEAAGIWLDEFHSHWISKEVIEKHLQNGKHVCIVSPDLHKRDYTAEWEHYKQIEKELGIDNLMLCTDYPESAKEFFSE